VAEPLQSLLVGAPRTTATVEASMLIEKLGEELLGSGFRGGMGGSPDLLPMRLKPNPVGRITLINGRHVVWRLCQR
jgi:hypothetical protein